MHMKKCQLVLFTLLGIILVSCQTDSEKADHFRLENKFAEAAELYKKAAAEGDAYAKWRLFKAYSNGDGVDYDERTSLELLKQAAAEGCEEAKCDLAFAYMFDWYDIGKDEDKGKSMLEELVKKTDKAYIQSRYAALLFSGGGPYEENKEKAQFVFENIKDKNNPEYLYQMGNVYLKGSDNIDINIEKAIDYFSKGFERGRRYGAYLIQSLYASGYGDLKSDKKKRIEWLNRGIHSNETNCMVDMAGIYLSEDSTLQDIHNPQKGIELYKKAARHGNGKAYFALGNIYNDGEFVSKDDNKAFDYWKKAAALKDHFGAANLGYAYINGIGCAKDVKKGIEVWKQAVEYGSGYAANNLFRCYSSGEYGEKDKALAKKYLIKAAELNDAWGCLNLGTQYYLGNYLMEKSYGQAFVYVKKAADMGLIDACNVLAYFYENGIGCDKNPQKAKEYKDRTVVKD